MAMRSRIIIPVRSLGDGKSRLSHALAPRARAQLVGTMFRHVLGIAQACEKTYVVSRDPALLAQSGNPICDTGHDLNSALSGATTQIGGTSPLLALSADLPFLEADDLAAMLDRLRIADLVIAPDRQGTGTNALLLASPDLIPFRFGRGSFAAHQAEGNARGLRVAICHRPGLATDIDQPEDLALLPRILPDVA